jgi:alcohol dehydrogenase YqhD (iron-dependent ADH family)
MRFAQVATRVWGCEMNFAQPEVTALEGIKRFRRFLHDIGMPINFEELGAKESDIPALVKTFGLGEGETGGFVHLKSQDIENIYKLAVKARLE